MIVNDTIINASCEEILTELQRQLAINKIPYLQKSIDSGKNIMVQCPYHGNGQERRPSAGIKKSDGTFHCFACNEVHTLPEVISYCFGKDDMFGRWGMKWIIKNFVSIAVEEREDVEIDLERNHTSHKNSILDNYNTNKSNVVTETELDSYRYYHEYWEDRGITDDDIIELFDLGYDIETDCITFPVRDEDGNCLFVAKRSVKTKWFNYPKDVDKPLYGLYELKESKVAINKLFITESMIDTLLLWQAGLPSVALNGTGSALQFEQLRHLPWRHYVLATDNDKAGQEARNKIRQNVRNKMFTEIEFPYYIKDIGDLGKQKRFAEIRCIEGWEVF